MASATSGSSVWRMRMAPESKGWAEWWPGLDLDALAADIDARLVAAADAWDLGESHTLEGGYVAHVVAADDVVVKLNPRGTPDDDVFAAEGSVLRAWRSSGVVVDV